MRIRLRNILLLFVVSLSLNGSAGNFSACNNEDGSEASSISLKSPQDSPVDIDFHSFAIRPDSTMVIKKVDIKDYDTTSTIKIISVCKKDSSPKEEKITMFELLVKWITLLLELS